MAAGAALAVAAWALAPAGPLASSAVAQTTLGAAEPARSPRSVIPWLDDALSGADPAAPPSVPPAPAVQPPITPGAPGAPALPADGGAAAAASPPSLLPDAGAAAPSAADPDAPARAPSRAPRLDGGVDPATAAATAPAAAPAAGVPAQPDLTRPVAPAPALPAAAVLAPDSPFTQPGALGEQDTGGGVSVAPLGNVPAVAAGLAEARTLGLPDDAWGQTSDAEAALLMDRLRPSPFRSANALTLRLLSLTLTPPRATPAGAAGAEADPLRARFAALQRFGAARAAAALAAATGDPAAWTHATDAALLTAADDGLCTALLASTQPSSARIYCQAIGGDGFGALTAIDASRALGVANETEFALLEALAEPALAEFVTPPASSAGLTPVAVAAMRRLGFEPPLDFARAAPLDLVAAAASPEMAPRLRLEALERLEAAGAVETTTLFQAFAETSSAESGGVWGRVEAHRRALDAGSDAYASALALALRRGAEAGHADQTARLLARETARRALPASGAPAPGLRAASIRAMLRLGGEGDAASALMVDPTGAEQPGPEERARDRVAAAFPSAPWRPEDAAPLVSRAARGDGEAGRTLAALTALGAETLAPDLYAGAPGLSFALAEGRVMETALTALADLQQAGARVAPETLYKALQRLVAVGLREEARRIATEAIALGE